MATDGADFQRRRIFHGKYYVEVKNGADAARLAQVSVDCLVRELRQDFQMPMLRPMVDAVVACIHGRSLFARNPEICMQELSVQLSPIQSQFSESGATREVCQLLIRAGLETRSQADGRSVEEYRDTLLRKFGHDLLQEKSLEFAEPYTAAHRGLDDKGLENLEHSIHDLADADLLQLAKAIYESGRGVPTTRWRGASESMMTHSVEALSNEVLAPEA
jgi:uncharacterized protein YhdP